MNVSMPSRHSTIAVFAKALFLLLTVCLALGAQGARSRLPVVHQRALISWRDGEETLLIESPSQVGAGMAEWLVPVPARPRRIETVSAAALDEASAASAPSAVGKVPGHGPVGAAFGLLIAAVASPLLLRESRWKRVAAFLAASAFLGGFGWYVASWPSSPDAGTQAKVGPSANPVPPDLLRRMMVAIPEVRNGEEHDAWLSRHRFAAFTRVTPEADEYIRQGWSFVAVRAPAVSAAKRLLRLTFRSPRPVFPTWFVANPGTKIAFDLFVVGDRYAEADGFQPWMTADLTQARIALQPPFQAVGARFDLSNVSTGRVRLAKADTVARGWRHLAQPDLTPVLWPGAKWTRLRANLTPTQMRHDLSLSWRQKRPAAVAVLSPAAYQGALVNVLGLCVGLPYWLGTLVCFLLDRRRGWPFVVGVAAAGLGLICGLAVWPSSATVADYLGESYSNRPSGSVAEFGKALDGLLAEKTGARFPQELRARVGRGGRGPLAVSSRFDEGPFPGGFTVQADGEGWTVVVYDEDGVPQMAKVGRDGAIRPLSIVEGLRYDVR